MSGLFLTMVCLILSVLVLTMGPLSAESSRTGGIDRNYPIQKKSCSREAGEALLAGCGDDDACKRRVDRIVARNCGARKRTFGAGRDESGGNSISAARGQSNLSDGLHRFRFSKRMEWR